MPVTGVMPTRRLSSPRTSSGWWRSMVVTLAVLAVCQLLPRCASPSSPRISSKLVIWRRTPAYCSASIATEAVEGKLRRSSRFVSADREAVHQPWRGSYATCSSSRWAGFVAGRRSYAACGCGRQAVSLALPWLPLTERRSFFNLPAMEPKGRHFYFFPRSVARCHGAIAAPSGSVPGGSDVILVRKKTGTRLRSLTACWGLFCKSQGPACNFQFLLGLVVGCVVLMLSIK